MKGDVGRLLLLNPLDEELDLTSDRLILLSFRELDPARGEES